MKKHMYHNVGYHIQGNNRNMMIQKIDLHVDVGFVDNDKK